MLMVPRLFTNGGSMDDPLLTLITPLLLRPAKALSTSPGPFRLICPIASLVSRPLTVIVLPPPLPKLLVARSPELSTVPVMVSVLPFSTVTIAELIKSPPMVALSPAPKSPKPLLPWLVSVPVIFTVLPPQAHQRRFQ